MYSSTGTENTVYSSTGREKYSVQFYWDGEIQCTVLLGQRNTVLQNYLLFTIQLQTIPETYFRYYILLFKIALNSLFIDQGVSCVEALLSEKLDSAIQGFQESNGRFLYA